MPKKSNVYKDKSGWYYKLSMGTDPETKKRRSATKRGFATQREALDAYIEAKIEWDKKKEELSSSNISFIKFKEELFLPWYKGQVKPNTYNRRELLLYGRLKIFDTKIMRNVTIVDAQTFQTSLLKEGLGGGYINMLIILMSTIWKRAKKLGYVDCNPFYDAGRVRVEPKKIKFWTVDVFQKFESCLFPKSLEAKVLALANLTLFEYYDFFHYLYYRFLFFSGVRFGESATLLWENVNEMTGLIKIMYTIGNIGKKKAEQYFSTPKSKSSIRDLYLDSRTIQLMKIWKIYQQKSGEISLVFSHDDLFLDQGWIWKKFRTLQEQYDLPRISVHDLRHSHASLLIHLGESPKMIQKRLGHKDIAMTLGTYAHLYPNSELELVQKLEKAGI